MPVAAFAARVFLAHVEPLTNLDTIASQIHRRSQHSLLHPQCVKSVLFKLPPVKNPVDGASWAWLTCSKQALGLTACSPQGKLSSHLTEAVVATGPPKVVQGDFASLKLQH